MNQLLFLLQQPTTYLLFFLGLVVGSFINVVVYRLPKILDDAWTKDARDYLAQYFDSPHVTAPGAENISLFLPASFCPHCKSALRWRDNIPVLSWLWLRGLCAHCHASIALRYPLIEFFSGVLFVVCFWRWSVSPVFPTGLALQTAALGGFGDSGVTLSLLCWCGFCAFLLTIALLDWDTTYLPDTLSLPLLWIGLMVSALHLTEVSLDSALWGVVAGYSILWLAGWLFRLWTGQEGMARGDFKFLAALGAWLGWQSLLPVLLMACFLGTLIGFLMKHQQSLRGGQYLPFGPFLAFSGWLTMLIGTPTILDHLFIY